MRTQTLELLDCRELKIVSRPGESERDVRIRLRDRARERRNEATAKIRKRYASRIRTLTERIRRSEQAVERETEQASQQKLQTALSFGATVLSALLGRSATSRSTLGGVTTAARGVGRSMKEAGDISRARATLAQLQTLEAELYQDVDALGARLDPSTLELSFVTVPTSQRRVAARLVALAWRSRD